MLDQESGEFVVRIGTYITDPIRCRMVLSRLLPECTKIIMEIENLRDHELPKFEDLKVEESKLTYVPNNAES